MVIILPFLLAFMAVTLVSSENNTSDNAVNLPTPRIYGISQHLVDEEGSMIHWILDEESDDTSVLGYKFKLWEVGCARKPKYKIVDGKRLLVKNLMPKLRDYSTLHNLMVFTVEGKNNTNLLLKVPKDIHPDVPYHVLVSAYSSVGEGPLSRPFRFQHSGLYTCRVI